MISFDFKVRIEDKNFRFAADLLSERTAILGRSGAGKSTLVKAIAGLLRPESGYIKFGKRIFFDSEAAIDLPPQKRGIGFVFQNHRLFPFMSVKKNLLFGRQFAHRQNALSFEEVVRFLELEPLLNKSPSKLSGGESQRVALGRALLCAENFMILDEPLSSLDPVLSNSLQDYLERIHSFAELPYLYITHRPNEALRLTEEALLIAEGQNILLGKTHEVLNQSQFLRSE